MKKFRALSILSAACIAIGGCSSENKIECPVGKVCLLVTQDDDFTLFEIKNNSSNIYSFPSILGLDTDFSRIELRQSRAEDRLKTAVLQTDTNEYFLLIPRESIVLSVRSEVISSNYGLAKGCAEHTGTFETLKKSLSAKYPYAIVRPFHGRLCF